MEGSRFVLEAGNYVFREIVAPEGFEISTEIQFKISDYGEITNIFVQGDNRVIGSYIVMVDNYKPIPGEPQRPYYGAPKTGDRFAIGMYGSLIALAGGALDFLRVKDKKDKE